HITFAQMNLFRMPLKLASFDVGICADVLPHTHDPVEGFKCLASMVRSGGHVVIDLNSRYGRFTTHLRGFLIKEISKCYAAMKRPRGGKLAPGDKDRNWFSNYLDARQASAHTMDEVLGWFAGNGIDFVRALLSTILGSQFELEYRASLFTPESCGPRMDRV